MPRTIELGTNVFVEDEKFETKKLDGRETLGPLPGVNVSVQLTGPSGETLVILRKVLLGLTISHSTERHRRLVSL